MQIPITCNDLIVLKQKRTIPRRRKNVLYLYCTNKSKVTIYIIIS